VERAIGNTGEYDTVTEPKSGSLKKTLSFTGEMSGKREREEGEGKGPRRERGDRCVGKHRVEETVPLASAPRYGGKINARQRIRSGQKTDAIANAQKKSTPGKYKHQGSGGKKKMQCLNQAFETGGQLEMLY